MAEAVQSAGVIMKKAINDKGIVLPVTELMWLWWANVGMRRSIGPSYVGTAIVGTAKVVRR